MRREEDSALASQASRARDGDSEAWGLLYERLAPSIYRLCLRALESREEAEDATGEVFLKARLRLDQYDASRPFSPWLYRVAANHCWDELRRRRSRPSGVETDPDATPLAYEDEHSPTPEEALLAEESREEVRRAIASLDDRSRLALVLRYFADMGYTEIAGVLQVSESFVGVLLLRARRRLRRKLAAVSRMES